MRLRLLLPSLLLAACDLPFSGPDGERVGFALHSPAMTVDLTSGAPFVTVITSGPLGCSRPTRTELKRSGNSLVVVPYDQVLGQRCASMFTSHKHTVFLDQFPPGTYQISAKVFRPTAEQPYHPSGDPVVVETTEVVLP